MEKQELLKIKELIEQYKKDAFEHQEKYGFQTIFDELYDPIYEIEKIVDSNLEKC